MITMEEIQAYANKIAEKFNPNKIILFGSYAYGTPREESDVDLMVVMPFEGWTARQASKICTELKPPFPLDILARTPERFSERLQIGDKFIQKIFKEGKILYDKD